MFASKETFLDLRHKRQKIFFYTCDTIVLKLIFSPAQICVSTGCAEVEMDPDFILCVCVLLFSSVLPLGKEMANTWVRACLAEGNIKTVM